MALCEEALVIRRESLAPEDPAISHAMGNLASTYLETGRSAAATPK